MYLYYGSSYYLVASDEIKIVAPSPTLLPQGERKKGKWKMVEIRVKIICRA
jgi:hypothetical protein